MSIDVMRGVIIGCVTILLKKFINAICNGFNHESARDEQPKLRRSFQREI